MTGFLLLASGLLAGCIFSPDKGDENKPPPPPPEYPELSTPQAVLEALRIAYESRDSSGYLRLFEGDYKGASYDTSEVSGNQPGEFTRVGEEMHIRSLAENPNITSVDLYMAQPWTRSTVISDNGTEEWAYIAIFNPQIGVTDGATTVQTVANETFEFSFRPTVDFSSSTDTLWHIVRWTEAP